MAGTSQNANRVHPLRRDGHCVAPGASPIGRFRLFRRYILRARALLERLPYLKGAALRRSAPDTLTVTVDRGGPVQLYFFGGLILGQVSPAETVEGPGFKVAALIDLVGMKVAVVTQRAELKDYLDIHALLTKAGIPLPKMLAAGGVIYGAEFNPLLSLKAIAYHNDPTLADLPDNVKHDLSEAVKATTPQQLPVLSAVRMRGANS